VIRRLEGLGHIEMVNGGGGGVTPTEEDTDADIPSSNVSDGGEREFDDEVAQVEKELYDIVVNGVPVVPVEEKTTTKIKKVDWEIPRKLLHSSIGVSPLSFLERLTYVDSN
jgi:hypothetical protein